MSSKKPRKKLGEERLQHIIELCRSVEERSLDPFVVNIDDLIAVVREYFPKWELLDEFCLDSEAIHQLASIIKLQSDWVRHRSTSLYTDPFLLEEKIRKVDREELVSSFLAAWHPIVELEQISPSSLAKAIEYWQNLLPLDERWLKIQGVRTELGVASQEELVRQRILLEKAFTEELVSFWEELKNMVGDEGRIRYWDFVGSDSYEETLQRAYLTSFLVTYGYATLEIYRLEEEMFVRPFGKPVAMVGTKQAVSVPVSLSFEEWERWRNHRQN